MSRIFKIISARYREHVLDADIENCFGAIAHKPLLDQIGPTFPAYKTLSRWLKAGYVENGKNYKTIEGTPQGGIISPLLSNIALTGLEEALGMKYRPNGQIRTEYTQHICVRYADDFVVFNKTKEDAIEAKEKIRNFLKNRGLTFSNAKTRISSIYEGFDFLGFNFRVYDKTSRGNHVTLVLPSLKSIKKLKDKVRLIWHNMQSHKVYSIIGKLNPIIRGFANYYVYVNCNKTFRILDNFMFNQCIRWVRRKHPQKSWKWIKNKYFKEYTIPGTKSTYRWVFTDPEKGSILLYFHWFKPKKYTATKGITLPDNPRRPSIFRPSTRQARNC